MIHMAVGVNHRHHGPARPVPVVELKRGGGHLTADQGIHNDQAGIALDHVHIGEVETANLINPFAHLEQPGMVVQPRQPPEAGVHRVRRFIAVLEIIGAEIPHHPAVGVTANHVGVEVGDKATGGVIEVGAIVKRQSFVPGVVALHRGGLSGLGLVAHR